VNVPVPHCHPFLSRSVRPFCSSRTHQGHLRCVSLSLARTLTSCSAHALISSLPAGHAHVVDVLTFVFQFLALLRAPGAISEATFADNAALHALTFDYREKPDPFHYTSSLAHGMHLYPLRHLLQASSHVPLKWDEAAVRGVLDALRPEECNAMWVSQDHAEEGMETEEWCVHLAHARHCRAVRCNSRPFTLPYACPYHGALLALPSHGPSLLPCPCQASFGHQAAQFCGR
jgi:secreted Zn-dependent insulinase-like peptidase